jgi:hypothetical protein
MHVEFSGERFRFVGSHGSIDQPLRQTGCGCELVTAQQFRDLLEVVRVAPFEQFGQLGEIVVTLDRGRHRRWRDVTDAVPLAAKAIPQGG